MGAHVCEVDEGHDGLGWAELRALEGPAAEEGTRPEAQISYVEADECAADAGIGRAAIGVGCGAVVRFL